MELFKRQFMEGRTIKHIGFYSTLIETMGYDPQCALLEVKLICDRKIRQYENVPEYIWYHLREDYHPDVYYRRYVCGRYEETVLPGEEANPPEEESNPSGGETDLSGEVKS